jgi:hypothetical protein
MLRPAATDQQASTPSASASGTSERRRRNGDRIEGDGRSSVDRRRRVAQNGRYRIEEMIVRAAHGSQERNTDVRRSSPRFVDKRADPIVGVAKHGASFFHKHHKLSGRIGSRVPYYNQTEPCESHSSRSRFSLR